MRTTGILILVFLLIFGKECLTACSTDYGAKPCIYTPAPPGKSPYCARAGYTYCEHPVHYPRHLIHYLIEKSQFNYSTLLTSESTEEFSTYFIPNKPNSVYGAPNSGYDYYTASVQKLEDSYLYPPKENNSYYGYPEQRLPLYNYKNGHFNHLDHFPSNRGAFSQYYSHNRQKRQADLIRWQSYASRKRRKRFIYSQRVKRQSVLSGQRLCETRSQYIMPRAAVNHKGNWMYIVNMPELDNKYMQLVRSETCISQECSGLCQLPVGYSSRCEQKYLQRRLIALEETGNQLYSDIFWFPTCCVCTLAN